jgi:hypothetical protein
VSDKPLSTAYQQAIYAKIENIRQSMELVISCLELGKLTLTDIDAIEKLLASKDVEQLERDIAKLKGPTIELPERHIYGSRPGEE